MRIVKTLSRERAIFCVLIAAGIILHLVPYIYNRSLWIDEAMLASSLLTRGFGELVAYPLDFGQSAPVGYLYIVKALTTLLGSEEYVLRLWSFFSFVCCAGLLYLVLSSVFEVKHPEIFTLLFVLIPFFLRYSNEFKPYMSDNMFVILSLLLLGKWYRQKLSFPALIASYSVIIWFSFASAFFIASAMIIITSGLVREIFRTENKMRAVLRIAECMIVALSFGVYYKFWLSVSSSHAGGQDYFALTKFIFVPLSFRDIYAMIKAFHEILTPLLSVDYTLTALTGLLALAGIRELFRNSVKEVLAAVIGSVLLMCIASSIGFYPIGARLTQFVAVEVGHLLRGLFANQSMTATLVGVLVVEGDDGIEQDLEIGLCLPFGMRGNGGSQMSAG